MSQSKLLVIFQFTGNTSFNVAISSGCVLLVNFSLKAGVIVSFDISGCSIQSKQRSSCRFCTNSTSWSPCCSKGAMGFCVFGNIVIAARYAQRMHGLKRVFIIDFDVHHGNGTNDAFYEDPDIFFLSTHQAGSYPGTGKIDQIGSGNGERSTLNLPLPGGSGDTAMRTVFDEVIVPCAQRFKPDIILVSAGYDAHLLDPLASLQITTGTYYMLASSIKQLARDLCGGHCVFFLEGGYNLSCLSNSVAESFRALLGDRSLASELDDPSYLHEEPLKKVKQIIEKVKQIHSF
ncbi:histone deacetylase 14, chloroplastic-like [Solanum verrucosum]|uniref:histone deacetylase 14, chloroplastic-like n=1 Tax=Solanum verrucosum TaxID=315347 RepID=UPI0020D07CB4|nr:histone deacetylase 14, chloroplastic-like [Solanum verrucosum]